MIEVVISLPGLRGRAVLERLADTCRLPDLHWKSRTSANAGFPTENCKQITMDSLRQLTRRVAGAARAGARDASCRFATRQRQAIGMHARLMLIP
jgi:hypothetical protein